MRLKLTAIISIVLLVSVSFFTPASAYSLPGLNMIVRGDISLINAELIPPYTDEQYAGGVCLTNTVANIDFNWESGGPCSTIDDYFTTYFYGYIKAPITGTVYFFDQSDDGFYMTLDGTEVISDWELQGVQSPNGSGYFNMVKDHLYFIKVWNYENEGGAAAKLFWGITNDFQDSVIVPNSCLSTDGNSWSGSCSIPTDPTPKISYLSPWYSNVAGGTVVTIIGKDFEAGATVSFGSAQATDVTFIDAYTLTARTTINSNISEGNNWVNVTVTNPSGRIGSVGNFFYSKSPSISTISPNSGPTSGGTEIQVEGSSLNLIDPLTSILFNGTAIAPSVYSSDFFRIIVPSNSAGSVSLSVLTMGGLVTIPNAFTYSDIPAPTITSISPTSGTTAGGTTVTISGSNLTDASSVTFGGTAGTITSNTSSQIVVTTPAKSAGSVAVLVTTPGGSVTSGTSFTFVSSTTSSNNRQTTSGSCNSSSLNATVRSSGNGTNQNSNAFCAATTNPAKK